MNIPTVSEHRLYYVFDGLLEPQRNVECIGVFPDINKAFDTVDYTILLAKLYHHSSGTHNSESHFSIS